jgi:hypothetical protein
MGSVLATTYSSSLTGLGAMPAPARLAVRNSLGGAVAVARHLGPLGRVLLASADHAFLTGLSAAMLTGAGVSAAGVLVAGIVLPGARRDQAGTRASGVPASAGAPSAQPASTENS